MSESIRRGVTKRLLVWGNEHARTPPLVARRNTFIFTDVSSYNKQQQRKIEKNLLKFLKHHVYFGI